MFCFVALFVFFNRRASVTPSGLEWLCVCDASCELSFGQQHCWAGTSLEVCPRFSNPVNYHTVCLGGKGKNKCMRTPNFPAERLQLIPQGPSPRTFRLKWVGQVVWKQESISPSPQTWTHPWWRLRSCFALTDYGVKTVVKCSMASALGALVTLFLGHLHNRRTLCAALFGTLALCLWIVCGWG